MRAIRVHQLHHLAQRYYMNRIDKSKVTFKRFFRRVKENYLRFGAKTVEAMEKALVR